MEVGLHVDPEAVEALRVTIDTVLQSVAERLEANDLIKQYQNSRLPAAQKKHAAEATACLRDRDYYMKEFKSSDIVHRTWVVNTYLHHINKEGDKKDKWTLKDLKQYNIFLKDAFIGAIVEKRNLTNENGAVLCGMHNLAMYKLNLWNRPRLEKAEAPVVLDVFNPGSPKQKSEFFAMLKIEPLARSKDTGEASWGRDQLEELLKSHHEGDLHNALLALIDFSFSAIIKNNFIKAFDSYTIDGVMHGNVRLFGAKSFRNTSNSPNLLNAPSSRSIYAKPLKRCFIAPDGYVIYTADLAALEDRVIANLSGDTNKQNIFLQGLDGHSLNSCGYWPERIEKVLGYANTDNVEYVKEFYRRIEEDKNEILKKIRFNSKEPTFKLAYGGFPDSDRPGGVITQEIFDNYHNVLYPGITKYREEYVLPFTRANGYIHLGLGCRMYSSDAGQAIRTLNNATVQFWSILTLIAINELNYRIAEEGLENYVQVCSTIYDSIYTYTIRDAGVLQWVNDNMIEVMTVPYLEDETIHNEATGEIGLNWADLHKIPNGASVDDIDMVLEAL
jgi:DNA polymerase-1